MRATTACLLSLITLSLAACGDAPKEGAQGPAGPQGAQGPQGQIGPQGPQGIAGPQGPVGPAGPAGERGASGPVGPAGPTGLAGEKGEAGPPGLPAPTGAKGDSAAGPPADSGRVGPLSAQGPDFRVVIGTDTLTCRGDEILVSLVCASGPSDGSKCVGPGTGLCARK